HYYEKIKISDYNANIHVDLVNSFYETLEDEAVPIIANNPLIGNEIAIKKSIIIERKVPFASISFIPVRKNQRTGKYEKLVQFALRVKTTRKEFKQALKGKNKYTSNSVLASGDWFKIAVTKSGIHKITFNDLQGMGLSGSSFNLQTVGVFGNGGGMLPEANAEFRYDDLQENAIEVVDVNQNNNFDAGDHILFYAESPHIWEFDNTDQRFHHIINDYSEKTHYFITVDKGTGKRITSQASMNNPNTFVTSFDDYRFHERNLVNLMKSGRKWYGETFDFTDEYNFTFSFPDIDLSSKAYYKTIVVARSTIESSFNININGISHIISVPYVLTSYQTDYAIATGDTLTFYPGSSTINFNYKYNKTTSSSIGWLNYIELNVRRNLNLSASQMLFRDIRSIGNGNISQFSLSNAGSNVKIWEVTDPMNIQEITSVSNNNTLTFTVATDSLRQFIAFNGNSYFTPEQIGRVENQNLHGLGQYDFVIVSHPNFLQHANELANYHYQNDNLSSIVVTAGKIYNEFSSGSQDVAAIRDFMKMFYDRAGSDPEKLPKYLLLFGDGSYDPLQRIASNTNYVITYHSKNSLKPTASYVTDDFFGLLDDSEGLNANGNLDIGIGRFPVQSAEEAQTMINKVKRYAANTMLDDHPSECSSLLSVPNLSDWRNNVCFVADDEDGNLHLDQAEAMAVFIDTTYKDYNVDKIYFDSYIQESTPGGQRYGEVNEAINNRVSKGALIVNYTGHGGEVGWSHERVLEISDIIQWCNYQNLPVFITATCEFSRFDDPERVSAGELVILNANGGAISLFTTTRLAFSHSNFALNMNFHKNAFKKIDGEWPRMGDLIRKAKTPSNSYIRNFVLLGDPALQMVYPEFNVITSKINGRQVNSYNSENLKKSVIPADLNGLPVNDYTDTLKALKKVTISGFIAANNGNKVNDFNGIIYPTVFDKPTKVTTIGNDPTSYSTNFRLQKNILYKGKASVTNGEFSFTFIVPKDIAYQYGYGKISYYAQNGETDANGYFDKIIVGGSENNVLTDETGPEIEVYLNDENFVFGGITNEDPILLSYVFDSNGINTVGNGIGHDLVAILDENTEHTYVLNDYYEADLNSYTRGTIKYPFQDLSEGLHTLKIKVWDVYNNSSEAYTEFVVASSTELALDHVMNYPNPFTTRTAFYFEHNQPSSYLDVIIQIFTITGKLIKTINESVITDGYRVDDIYWNGRDDFGDPIGRGVYIYKLKVRTDTGSFAEETEKLVILK
ncbi:type IX secretion system sortase PorU, partial [candidate division KSB1 bacterium]